MLFLAFACLSFAQETRFDAAAAAAQVTEFDVNGLKVILKRRPSAPTVAAALFVRGGSRNIDAKTAGIEDLTLKTAIEAGKKYPRQTVRRELSRTGSGIAAGASEDFSIVSLAVTRPNFDHIWDIFTNVLLDPTFADEDIERNRRATLSALGEQEVSPEGALEADIGRVIYAGHPYANDVNGTAATINSFKAADLIAWHKKIMQTSRLLLVFVGDLDANELKTRIAASFGKLPRGDYKEPPYPPLNFDKPTLDIVARPNIPTNYVEGVFNAPSLADPDYYPMQVAISILQQLVTLEVRNNRQLSYAPAAEINKSAANTANISVSSTDANQSVSVMLEQIDRLKKQTLSDEVVSEVAGNFLTTYYLGQETSAGQAGELARYELIGGGWRNTFEFLDRIRKVKPADVQAVSNKYMRNLRFVVVGNPAQINRSIFLPNQ
jgi:zinc protease